MIRSPFSNQSGSILLYSIIGIVVLAIVVVGGWAIYENNHKTYTPPGTNVTYTTPTSSPSTVTPAPGTSSTLPAGTDNTTLQSDVSNISAALGQQTTDQAQTNAAINDQSSEISVPTN